MALLRLWALIFLFGLVSADSDSGSDSNESGKGGKYRDILKIFTQMRKNQEHSNTAPHHYNHPAYPMPAPPIDYYAQPPPPWYNYPGYPPPPHGYVPYPSPSPGAYQPHGGQPIGGYHPNAIVQPIGGYYLPPQYQQPVPAAYNPQQNPNQQPTSEIHSATTTPQTSPSSSSNSNSSTVINLQSPGSGSDPKIAQPPQGAGSGQQSVTYESTSYTRQLPPEYLYVAPGAQIPGTHQR